jgi:RNA polymerase sigma factor for flagellar operon FliA
MATDLDAQVLERRSAEAAGIPPQAAPGGGFQGGYASHLDEGEIIRQFVPVVKRLALRLKGRMPETVELDDLIQAGLIAVLRLSRHVGLAPPSDPALQRSVVNAMIDEVRREAWAPVRTVRLAKAAGQAMRAVKSRLRRDGSDEEIAAEMGLPLENYHTALVEIAGIRLLHLDDFDEAGGNRLLAADNQDAALDRSRMMAALAESISALPEREKLVLSLYYEQELNMEEVGAVLGLDKSTVCRVHGRALLMLRNVLADWRAEATSPSPGSGD